MIYRQKIILLLFMLLATFPGQAEASVFSDALAKARSAMQSAFQLSFLHKLPVIFYKDSFDQMFAHANSSIESMNLKYGDRTITRNEFQDDKATHIKKSAELALHIKSLIGSAHLAYGITMVVGLLKEAIDGSFLNPGGSRSKEDIYADHVGARAVFGQKKFDASLEKHLGSFVKPQAASDSASTPASADSGGHSPEPSQVNPFASDQKLSIGNNSAEARQKLLKSYYEAVERGDSVQMKAIAVQLQAQP